MFYNNQYIMLIFSFRNLWGAFLAGDLEQNAPAPSLPTEIPRDFSVDLSACLMLYVLI